MRKNNSFFLSLIAALVFVSCSPNLFPVETAKGTDFSKYKTYAFLPTDDTSFAKMVNRDSLKKALAIVAISELGKKGFTMDTAHPDCFFKYTLVMKRSYDKSQQQYTDYMPGSINTPYYNSPDSRAAVNIPSDNNTYTPNLNNPYQGQVYYFSSDIKPQVYSGKMQVVTMREGSFVIDMIDSKDKKVIWRSSFNGKRDETKLPSLQNVVAVIVPQMLKKIPKK